MRNSQIFRMEEYILHYDYFSSVLLCSDKNVGKKKWVKKLDDPGYIDGVVEDGERFFIACGSGEKSGIFICLLKSNGSTLWDIPGQAYLYRVFSNFIFLIFIDDSGLFFLLKVSVQDGSIYWHHQVSDDLYQYEINKNSILLKYLSGRDEKLDMESGSCI